MKYQIVVLKMEQNKDKDGVPTIDIPEEILNNAIGIEIISREMSPCIRCLMPTTFFLTGQFNPPERRGGK